MRSRIVIILLASCALILFQPSRPAGSQAEGDAGLTEKSAIPAHGRAAPWKQLKSWAARDPRAALRWLADQDTKTQTTRSQEAWRGAIRHPELALEIGREFMLTQPVEVASLHGLWLTRLLAEAGMSDRAMTFALGTPDDLRNQWIPTILSVEAARSPQSAAALWQQLPDGDEKQNAWKSILTTWSTKDPAGLCSHAISLSSTAPERAGTLDEAMRAWCMSDPASYTEWLNTIESQEDFENGLSLLITRSDSLFRSPADALNWAATITRPDLRFSCTTEILRQWAATGPDEAMTWIAIADGLDETQRANLLQTSFHSGFVPAE